MCGCLCVCERERQSFVFVPLMTSVLHTFSPLVGSENQQEQDQEQEQHVADVLIPRWFGFVLFRFFFLFYSLLCLLFSPPSSCPVPLL